MIIQRRARVNQDWNVEGLSRSSLVQFLRSQFFGSHAKLRLSMLCWLSRPR